MNINTKLMLVGFVELAGNDSKFTFYSGAQPTPGGVPAGVALADVVIAGVLGTITDGGDRWTLTVGVATEDTTIAADGTCIWARLIASDNTWIADLTVSSIGGGGDIQLRPNNNIVVGGKVNITSAGIHVLK